jgi:hypothetical protein
MNQKNLLHLNSNIIAVLETMPEYQRVFIEDINQVLHKNQDAEINPINKFLSVTDGLVLKYKKIIMSQSFLSKTYCNYSKDFRRG